MMSYEVYINIYFLDDVHDPAHNFPAILGRLACVEGECVPGNTAKVSFLTYLGF